MKSLAIVMPPLLLLLFGPLAISRAQEPVNHDRPQRFLMLLRVGDKIGWMSRSELNGYRVSIYSPKKYQTEMKTREEQETELKTLQEKYKEVPRAPTSFFDRQSPDPEVQQQYKDFQRIDSLSSTNRNSVTMGEIAFVGQDYIAVRAIDRDKKARERFIPAWAIVSISGSREEEPENPK